jgi:hypothetical protein
MALLTAHSVRILEMGKRNANYFFMEVDGKAWRISPFASHEEWWEKPSNGFRSSLKSRCCEWRVVLFVLPKCEGVWLAGHDFDEHVLKDKSKVNAPDVHYAIDRGIATTFRDLAEFISLLRIPPRRGTPFLLSKCREKSCG